MKHYWFLKVFLLLILRIQTNPKNSLACNFIATTPQHHDHNYHSNFLQNVFYPHTVVLKMTRRKPLERRSSYPQFAWSYVTNPETYWKKLSWEMRINNGQVSQMSLSFISWNALEIKKKRCISLPMVTKLKLWMAYQSSGHKCQPLWY